MNSPLFIDKTFTLKHLFNFLTLQECIYKFFDHVWILPLESLIQNINEVQQKKIIHKILQSFQWMKG